MADRTQEHQDAAIAMATAFINGEVHDMTIRNAAYGDAPNLDPVELGAAFASITAALVRHIARLEGRPAEQVWKDVAPIVAGIPPQN